MRVVSVQVGQLREVAWRDEIITTGIFKSPVDGPVRLGRLGLEGDHQADLSVHGGADKAVYVYPSEHYAFWRAELPEAELPWGVFGENLTTEGLDDRRVHVGDRLRIGEAIVVVTQPRLPCFKLSLRFGDAQMVKRFLKANRPGFYLAVEREGLVAAGAPIELLEHAESSLSPAAAAALYIPRASG